MNCIAPGLVYTPMVSAFLTSESGEQRRLAGLIKDEGTAQVLVVDGGITALMPGV